MQTVMYVNEVCFYSSFLICFSDLNLIPHVNANASQGKNEERFSILVLAFMLSLKCLCQPVCAHVFQVESRVYHRYKT